MLFRSTLKISGSKYPSVELIKRKKGAYFNVGAFYVPGGRILRAAGLLYQTRDERNQSKKGPIVGSTSTDSHSNEVTPPWPIPTIGPNIIIRYVTSCVNHKMGKGSVFQVNH